MKKFKWSTLIAASVAVFALIIFGLVRLTAVLAATSPTLGTASTYGVLASTYTDTSAATTINGDVGFTTPPATAPAGVHTHYGTSTPYFTAGTDQGTALAPGLSSQPCTFTFPDTGTAIHLDSDTTHGPIGVYTPGVYCTAATRAADITGTITLRGAGTYIFRMDGALDTAANSHVVLDGSSPCDVFWTPTGATTLGANSSFVGTDIDNAGISVGSTVNWVGRALDYATTVTTNADTITVPSCVRVIKEVSNTHGGVSTSSAFNLHVISGLTGLDVATSPQFGLASTGTAYTLAAGNYSVTEDANASYTKAFTGACDASGNITLGLGDNQTCTVTNSDIAPVATSSIIVVKTVVGGGKGITDFPLFINGSLVTSSATNALPTGAYTVTETNLPNYNATFSGDCNLTGHLSLVPGSHLTCFITNTYSAPVVPPSPSVGATYAAPVTTVPPLISVVKVPSPLALPAGPGNVNYTFTLHNIGTVPMTSVTVVDDSCTPVYVSGDANGNGTFEVNETWIYTCSNYLTETHMNTVVATGWNNGISAIDTANATVIVGLPIIPPLIHVTKVPNPLKLTSKGGNVTYTEKITNPGTVALSNVTLKDDKCGPMKYISGDTNHDYKLQPTETFTYTCTTKLTKTTTNTAVATGEANGITVRDFAIATVVVPPAVPKLPNTGVAPAENGAPWNVALLAGLLLLVSTSAVVILKKSKI